jgi:hypothetical protein
VRTWHRGLRRKRSSKRPTGDQPLLVEPAAEQSAAPAPGGKNPAAAALSRLGGKKGGQARAKKLTAEQRREIAKKAAQAQWAKKNQQG